MKDKYIIVDRVKLENIFLKHEKLNSELLYRIMSLSGSIMGSLILSILTTKNYQGVLFINEYTIKTLISTIAILSGSVFFITIIIWLYRKHNHKLKDLEDLQNNIIDNNLYTEEFTYILLFPKFDGKKLLFPVMQKDTWENSLFFPYLKHKYGNDSIMSHEKDIADEIRTKYSIPIPINIKEIQTDDGSIVKMKDGLPRKFHFKFLYISSLSPFFRSYLHNLLVSKGYTYLSLEDISTDRVTAINNGKVLSIIENNNAQIRKIYDKIANMQSKIIWNIDKTCANKCSICAYGNDLSSSLEIEELKRIVDAINSIDVTSIDLSMGNEANINIIQEIILYIKKTTKIKVNLTATAKFLSQFKFDFLNKNIEEIEITYDYPHTISDKKDLRPTEYNKQNYNFIKDLNVKKFNFRISANIVLHENISKDKIFTIYRNLRKISVNKYNFLRLMPVGNITYSSYPDTLYTQKFYSDMYSAISSKNTHIHCALNCVYGLGTICRMGISKLGISQTGKVYTCAWAEHIKDNITNPFFIGNIEDYENLEDMLLNNHDYLKSISYPQTVDCKIFSYLESNDIWSQSDKLYHK